MKKFILHSGVAAIVFGLHASADPWPERKPGLWQLAFTMQGSKMQPMSSKYCIDKATEDSLMNMGKSMMQQSCSKQDVHVSGGSGTIDTVCKFGNYTQTAHTTVVFTGDTAYQSQTRDHMSPPMPYGGSDHTTTVDARWMGPCPAGMKPGDIVMANGMKMHMGPGGQMSGMGRMGSMSHMGGMSGMPMGGH